MSSTLARDLFELVGEWVAFCDDQVIAHAPTYSEVFSLIRDHPAGLASICVAFIQQGIPDLESFVGQWIAVCGGRVVASAETYEALAHRFEEAEQIESCTIFRVRRSLVP